MTETYFDGENELTVVRDTYTVRYYLGNKLHRTNGPAICEYYENGNIESEEYRVHGKIHRVDGPAFIWYDKKESIRKETYWVNGKRHRLDGPAVICYYGKNTKEEYWVNGKQHRLDGPADVICFENGDIEIENYWINGEKIDTEQFPDIDFENWPLSIEEQTILKMSV